MARERIAKLGPGERGVRWVRCLSSVRHADVHALRDALTAIDRLGCDAVMCAGDILLAQ